MSQKAALISTLLAERRLCLTCLAAKMAMRPEAVTTAIEILGHAIVIHEYPDKACDGCGARTDVFMTECP